MINMGIKLVHLPHEERRSVPREPAPAPVRPAPKQSPFVRRALAAQLPVKALA